MGYLYFHHCNSHELRQIERLLQSNCTGNSTICTAVLSRIFRYQYLNNQSSKLNYKDMYILADESRRMQVISAYPYSKWFASYCKYSEVSQFCCFLPVDLSLINRITSDSFDKSFTSEDDSGMNSISFL